MKYDIEVTVDFHETNLSNMCQTECQTEQKLYYYNTILGNVCLNETTCKASNKYKNTI